jgi:hypothetical protein
MLSEDEAMLFHVSIDAGNPQHVASVIAELWGGEALPFPPVYPGSWAAFAGDDRGTMIEVYPAGVELSPGTGDADAFGALNPGAPRRTATHVAVATPLSVDAVMAIAAREGWTAKYRKRGDVFGVIEFWIENAMMIEVLTPDMQAEYLGAITIENWRSMLAAQAPVAAAA